jgi:hypothetical protein
MLLEGERMCPPPGEALRMPSQAPLRLPPPRLREKEFSQYTRLYSNQWFQSLDLFHLVDHNI